MHKKVTSWLFASILLMLPLLVNATAYEPGFADGVSYEQTALNTDYADSLNAPGGEMEVNVYRLESDFEFGLDGAETIELTLWQEPTAKTGTGNGESHAAYANQEVGWRGTF